MNNKGRRRQSQYAGNPGVVRIIAGKWRGSRIQVADLPGLRPTTDRVRETVFNWLAAELPGKRCLDLFAGSGALGLEAASRDALSVTMVERNKVAFEAIDLAVSKLSADQVQTVLADASQWLEGCEACFDIVFFDPPFGDPVGEKVLNQIQQLNIIKPGGLLYLEQAVDQGLQPDAAKFDLHRQKRFGQVDASLYRRR